MSDPFDNKTAAFYGAFVQAAYTMYKNAPDSLYPEPDGIPADYELGAWIHMSDFILTAKQPKFYGIVAHSKKDPNSRVIAIRGTEGAVEWVDDAAAIPTPFRQVPSAGRVASGFDRIYSSLAVVKRQLPGTKVAPTAAATATPAPQQNFSGSFLDQLDQEVTSREADRRPKTTAKTAAAKPGTRPTRTTVVTGHSLGAALATLFVMENHAKHKFDITTLCTFASPRVGNMEFVHTFNQIPITTWRMVNTPDLVPRLPPHIPILLDYGHVDLATAFDSSKIAPNNPLDWHIMETYLLLLSQVQAAAAPAPKP
jgi:hypothetical protein